MLVWWRFTGRARRRWRSPAPACGSTPGRTANASAKPVGFRMDGWQRGGTSRKARILNNIFYECGEAAIVFPTLDNAAEGSLYGGCLTGRR